MSSLVVEAVGIGWQAVLSLSEVWRSTLLGNDPIASLQPVDNFSGPGSLTSGSAFSGLLALIVGPIQMPSVATSPLLAVSWIVRSVSAD